MNEMLGGSRTVGAEEQVAVVEQAIEGTLLSVEMTLARLGI